MEMEDLPLPKAIEELLRGRDFANQLPQLVINEDGDGDGGSSSSAAQQNLVLNVLGSFTNTLFLLAPQSQRLSPMQLPDSSSDSQESSKSSTAKEPRGCNKRRKASQTWEKESETPTEDGHQWRKYGQKVILNAKYSRNYYRCTHKFDQGCQATKQVQRVQEEPPLYRSTYYGHHTCRNLLSSDIIMNSTSPSRSSILLSFGKSLPTPTKQDCTFFSSSFHSPLVKKECKEDIPSSSLDNSSRHVTLTSTLESHHRDVISGGVLYDSVELDDVFVGF